MADHLRLDLDLVELLAGVDTDDAADHLGDDDHVTQVRLDELGLLVGLGLLLGLAELLDQAHGLALQTAVEAAAGAGVHDITQLLRGEVEEPVCKSNFCQDLVANQRLSVLCGAIDRNGVYMQRREKVDILVEVNATVGKLLKLPLLLQLCGRHLSSA